MDDNYKHPTKEALYAFIETVLTNESVLDEIIDKFKFPQETNEVKFKNFLRDVLDEIYKKAEENVEEKSKFKVDIKILYDKFKDLNIFSAKEYIQKNGPRAPRKIKDLGRHKKRNSHDIDAI